LEANQPIHQDYLAADFYGSTSQMVALNYVPPACVRVLDPDLDPLNQMIPVLMREAARVSTLDPILPGMGQNVSLDASIFGEQASPPAGWCYYFETADLARQQGNWQLVAELGEKAFQQNDYPNDPSERLVFIEGYAHTGKWQQALELSRETRQVTAVMQPVLCRLWQRIDQNTSGGVDKDAVLQTAKEELQCMNW
jgi:hypothetical protein